MSDIKGKTFKRKNVKGLMLKSEPRAPASNSSGDGTTPGKQELSTLEIGVEFKLDIRSDDLKYMQELGAGNSGSVSKVMHVATKTIMARKVCYVR